MIKIFRRLRQSHLNENSSPQDSMTKVPGNPTSPIGKFLLYAIGEIILVVIGILIALQINNWNESRKEHDLAVEILKEIRKSLKTDIEIQLNPGIETIRQDISNIHIIEKVQTQKIPFHDSLTSKYRSLMFSKAFRWESIAYRNLENVGPQIIKNPELKNAILRLYNMQYPELENFIGNFSTNLIEFFRPEMRIKFRFVYDNSEKALYIPFDHDQLIQDQGFLNNVLTAKINFQNIANSFNKTKTEVEQVISMIDEEIGNP